MPQTQAIHNRRVQCQIQRQSAVQVRLQARQCYQTAARLTFPPQAIYSRPPIPQRCSSLERPSVPTKTSLPNGQIVKTEPAKTVLSKVQARLSAGWYFKLFLFFFLSWG